MTKDEVVSAIGKHHQGGGDEWTYVCDIGHDERFDVRFKNEKVVETHSWIS
jgi:hypothetical protein